MLYTPLVKIGIRVTYYKMNFYLIVLFLLLKFRLNHFCGLDINTLDYNLNG